MIEPQDQIPATGNYENGELASLIVKLKSIDRDNVSKLRRFSIMYAVLIVLYGILLVMHPTLTMIVIVAGFTVFLGVFRYSYRKARNRDYTQPVTRLLMQTRKSYRLFSPEYIVANIAAFSIIYASLHNLFSRYLGIHIEGINPVVTEAAVVVVFYALVLLLAYVIWRVKYRKVIRQIDECLEEMGE